MVSLRLTRALLLFATATTVSTAQSQQRRTADPNGGPPPPPPAGSAMNPRFPFAGAWKGAEQFESGPGSDAPTPITTAFAVADSAKGVYDGAQAMPDGGRVPFPGAKLADGVLTWESPNSGGGKWIYAAKIVGRDTLTGTMTLRGAPWNPSPEPVGKFTLVRLKPGER